MSHAPTTPRDDALDRRMVRRVVLLDDDDSSSEEGDGEENQVPRGADSSSDGDGEESQVPRGAERDGASDSEQSDDEIRETVVVHDYGLNSTSPVSQHSKDVALVKVAIQYLEKGMEANWRTVRVKYYAWTGVVAPVAELKRRLGDLYHGFVDQQSRGRAQLTDELQRRLQEFHDNRQTMLDEVLLEVRLDKRPIRHGGDVAEQWDAIADAFNAQLGPPAERVPGKQLRARLKRLHRAFRDPTSSNPIIVLSVYLRSLLQQYELINIRGVQDTTWEIKQEGQQPRNPEVGRVNLAKDSRMVRAFLDGAFSIRQSTPKIHELHQVVAATRGPDWTPQDVHDQIEVLAKASTDTRHWLHGVVTASKSLCHMLRDYNESVSRIRPYLAICNRGICDPQYGRSFDSILLEKALELDIFTLHSDLGERDAWVKLAEQLNALLQAKVLFTGRSCSARFNLLRDVHLGQVESSIVELTHAQRFNLESIEVRFLARHTRTTCPFPPKHPQARSTGAHTSLPDNQLASLPSNSTAQVLSRMTTLPVMEQLLKAITKHQPSKAGESNELVWETIRQEVNAKLGQDAIIDHDQCRQAAAILMRVYKTQYPTEYENCALELKQILGDGPSREHPAGAGGRQTGVDGTQAGGCDIVPTESQTSTRTRVRRAKPSRADVHQEAPSHVLEIEQRIKRYVDDKLRELATEKASKQHVVALMLDTGTEIKGIVEKLGRTQQLAQAAMAAVNTVQSELQAERTARTKLEKAVKKRFAVTMNAFKDLDDELASDDSSLREDAGRHNTDVVAGDSSRQTKRPRVL